MLYSKCNGVKGSARQAPARFPSLVVKPRAVCATFQRILCATRGVAEFFP